VNMETKLWKVCNTVNWKDVPNANRRGVGKFFYYSIGVTPEEAIERIKSQQDGDAQMMVRAKAGVWSAGEMEGGWCYAR